MSSFPQHNWLGWNDSPAPKTIRSPGVRCCYWHYSVYFIFSWSFRHTRGSYARCGGSCQVTCRLTPWLVGGLGGEAGAYGWGSSTVSVSLLCHAAFKSFGNCKIWMDECSVPSGGQIELNTPLIWKRRQRTVRLQSQETSDELLKQSYYVNNLITRKPANY